MGPCSFQVAQKGMAFAVDLEQISLTEVPSTAGELGQVEAEVAGEEQRDRMADRLNRGAIEEFDAVWLFEIRGRCLGGERTQGFVGTEDGGDQRVAFEFFVGLNFICGAGAKCLHPESVCQFAAEEGLSHFPDDRQVPEDPDGGMAVPLSGHEERLFREIGHDGFELFHLQLVESDFIFEHGALHSGFFG